MELYKSLEGLIQSIRPRITEIPSDQLTFPNDQRPQENFPLALI